MSAIAEVRVNLGSTWMIVAPFSRASTTKRNPTGCCSAIDDPMIRSVGVREILLGRGGAAAAERGAQTGHRGAMSYPGLIADRDHAEAGGEQLLDQVVLFVVAGRAAEMGDGRELHRRLAVDLLDERAFARGPNAIGDHVHRRFELELLPRGRVRGAVLHRGQAVGMRDELVTGGAFRAEMAGGDRRF